MMLGSHTKGPNNIICRAWARKAKPWSSDHGQSQCSYRTKPCSLEKFFSSIRPGRLWFLAFFPSPFLWTTYFSFYISLYPSSNVHVQVQLSRADTCPISLYPKWLGVVVKAEKHCSIQRRVFNCSNGSLSFILCRHIVQGSFIYQRRCVRLFPKLFLCCSYPFFQECLGDVEDRVILSHVSRLFGLSL